LRIATPRTSVSVAMPEASSSAPGASMASPLPEPEIESRCPPSTTISSASSLPWMVRITDGCVLQLLQAVNSSTLTSLRLRARARQWSRIHSAALRPWLLAK
jgi:hypothetical protein